MARRRLEAAIQAGKCIDEGKFTKADQVQKVDFHTERDGTYSLQFSFDGEELAVGYGNGGIEILDATTGKRKKELRKSRYGGLAITCLRYNPQNTHILLAGSAEGLVYACNTLTGDCEEIITEQGNQINCLDFCEDGTEFATAGKDLDVRIYDAKTYKIIKSFEGYHQVKNTLSETKTIDGHAQRIFALKYNPDNANIFVTGGWDNHLKIWDVRSGDGVKRTIHGPHICGDSLDLKDFQILTGSWVAKHSLCLFDYSSGRLIKDIPFHDEKGNGHFLYCAQFCDNGTVLAGGSGTNSAQAINYETGELLGEIKMNKPVQALDSTKGGRVFAVGGADPYLHIGRIM